MRFVLALIVLISGAVNVPIAAQESLKAGVASVVITPNKDMWMAGYASRSGPSEGKTHDLFSKALAIQDESGDTFIIVTTDLVGISAATSKAVSESIEAKHGIPRERIMLTASHTHSGPVVRDNLINMYGLNEEQGALVDEYTTLLPMLIVESVDKAIADLAPADVLWAQGECGFAVNRRQYTPGGVINGNNPIGPVDHSVPTLAVRREDGSLKAILFGYACHNTTVSFMQWCGDYAGFAQLDVEAANPGATAMFVTGCGADANPLPRRTLALATQYGAELAASVQEVVDNPMTKVNGPIHAAYAEIPLKLTPAPTRAEVEAQLQSDNVYIQRRAAHLLNVIEEKGAIPETYPYPIQVWRFTEGPQMTVLGGEVVVDYALRIKHEFTAQDNFVIGYANDVCSYIPSLRVLLEGGYEGDTSQIYYGMHGKWDTSIEEDIMAAIHELNEELSNQ